MDINSIKENNKQVFYINKNKILHINKINITYLLVKLSFIHCFNIF